MKLPLSYIWQPANDDGSNRLMIVLHGRGDSSRGFLWLQDELDIDPLNYLLLDAPNSYYPGFSWYDLPPNRLPGVLQSRGLLTDVLRETGKRGYPPERTFLFGFSQGCLMTLEFGARHKDRLAGYIGVSGYCHDTESLLGEMNPEVNRGDWLITHGTQDDVVDVKTTRAQMRRLQDAGFKMDYREYVKPHTIDSDRELADIRDFLQKRID